MCKNIKVLAKVKSGELTMCKKCKRFHLTFNNIFFEFNQEELNQFKDYLFAIDIDYWEDQYPCPKRNIPIPSLQKNLILVFNRQEIIELKQLFSANSYQKFKNIMLDDIDYKLILN